MSCNKKKLIFTTKAYEGHLNDLLSLDLASSLFERGNIKRKDFADGEHYTQFDVSTTPITNRDVVIIGGTYTDEATMDVYDMACAIGDLGAHRLFIVIPYFGYSTMERAVKDGEIVKAKTRARLFSSIPIPGSGAKVILFDLHAECIANYFEGNMKAEHVQGDEMLINMITTLASTNEDSTDYVLASTDAGRAKKVELLANKLHVQPSFVFKRRLDSGSTEVTATSAGVDGKHVIIYDDMIRTGGSLINAAKAYKDAGATRISVVSTHGVFAQDAVQKLQNCGLIDVVYVTDSHPNALANESEFIRVFKIATVLADKIAKL